MQVRVEPVGELWQMALERAVNPEAEHRIVCGMPVHRRIVVRNDARDTRVFLPRVDVGLPIIKQQRHPFRDAIDVCR